MSDGSAIQYFAKQKRIYPKRVWGRFRKLKWLIMILTLGVYYLSPWIRWDRGPNSPDQAILIDMANSRAYFFFIEIWPQEVYFITGILFLSAVGLFFFTSLFGRVWCGYSCPQTVWTDLFVWVERIVQGDRNTRMRRDKGPITLDKIWRITVTHIIWLLIGLLTAGAWVFYFNDAPTLLESILHFDVPFKIGIWIAGLTGATYLMAGFAREQVCTYMCPYARFQSAMFDKDSLIISYDSARGEPRGSHKAGESWEGRGHCVDCTACVQVCPMGIDIRDGLQMECIACGLCIDACDNIMDKLSLPRGLVRYDTENNQTSRQEGKPLTSHFIRIRTLYYAVILGIGALVMVYALVTRSPLELHILHDRNPLFVPLSDGSVRNGYEVRVFNKSHDHKTYSLSLSDLEGAEIRLQGAGEMQIDSLPVFADSVGNFRVFVTADRQEEARKEISFTIIDNSDKTEVSEGSIFMSRQP